MDRFKAPTLQEERRELVEVCDFCGAGVRYVTEDYLSYCDEHGMVETHSHMEPVDNEVDDERI